MSAAIRPLTKYEQWKALSFSDKVYCELGQVLTSKKAIEIVAGYGDDVASTVAKGKELIDKLGGRYIWEFIVGVVEATEGSIHHSTKWSWKIWWDTESTPAINWFLPRAAGAISGAIGSFFSRILPNDNSNDLKEDKCQK